MKKVSLITFLIISINIFSQEKKELFNSEFSKFIIQCNNIGKTIIEKNKATELKSWYEGINSEKVNLEIKKLESDINNSELDVTYYLVMLRKEPLIYSFHFYNKETKTEFGTVLISFKNRENNLVDSIKIENKEELEKLNTQFENEAEIPSLPARKLPPIGKKKN